MRGEPVLAVGVDDDAVTDWPSGAGLADRHPAVLDAVHALVVVEVVRLAVGQHEEQAALAGAGGQLGGGVADGGAEAGVEAGAEAARCARDGGRHRLVEVLRAQEHPVAAQRGEGVDRASRSPQESMPPASAASASRAMSMTVRPVTAALGGARGVEQDRDGEVARLVAAGAPDPVGAAAPARSVDPVATAASRSRSSPSSCAAGRRGGGAAPRSGGGRRGRDGRRRVGGEAGAGSASVASTRHGRAAAPGAVVPLGVEVKRAGQPLARRRPAARGRG